MFITLFIAVSIIALQAYVISYMGWDHSYGCLTRASFNILYPLLKVLGYTFIAGDIDKFKAHNSAYGHEEVNNRVYRSIRGFFQCCRLGDLVFRLYSGDEFIIATRSKDVNSMISRICASFSTEGFSITLVVITGSLDTSMLKILDTKKGQ